MLCLLLALGLVALHVPLDAFRADPAPGAGCCRTAPLTQGPLARAPLSHADGCPGVQRGCPTPAPRDGCEDGCHCGCCGGLPLAPEPAPGLTLPALSIMVATCSDLGARHARPADVFHPPRA